MNKIRNRILVLLAFSIQLLWCYSIARSLPDTQVGDASNEIIRPLGSQYILADQAVCGPYCLFTILAMQKHAVELGQVVDATPNISPHHGCSLSDLEAAASSYGLELIPGHIEPSQLVQCTMPVILHVKPSHFVVAYEVTSDVIRIFDPVLGSTMDVASQDWGSSFSGHGLYWRKDLVTNGPVAGLMLYGVGSCILLIGYFAWGLSRNKPVNHQ